MREAQVNDNLIQFRIINNNVNVETIWHQVHYDDQNLNF